MLKPEERTAICSSCSNRTFNPEIGLICGKTGEKPDFVNACNDYQADQAEIERKQEREKNSEPEISGFLAFFVYWSIPLGLLFTIISRITQWNTLSNFGPFGIAFELVFLAFYFYFQIYTIYGFVKRKPDAVFIAKYQLIVLAVINLLSVIGGGLDESNILSNTPRLCISIVWAVVFFVYLCTSEDVELLIPKKTRKLAGRNKILFILSLVIPILLYVGIISQSFSGTFAESAISAFCEEKNKSLPVQSSEGLNLDKISVNDDMVVYQYQYTDLTKEDLGLSEYYVTSFFGEYQKELAKYRTQGMSIDDDPLNRYIIKAKYGLGFDYYDRNNNFAYGYSFTPEEFAAMLEEDYVYHTSEDFYEKFFDYYSSLIPYEYFEGAILNDVKLSSDGKSMKYDFTLTGIPRSSLVEMTSSYVKNYMLSILPDVSDASLTIAAINGLDLSYHFSADNFDSYATSFIIKAEEYNKVQATGE